MGYSRRGVKDGTGPYKNSRRRTVEKKTVGRRRARLGHCPKSKGK
jgi:hypothetical protein